MSAIVIERSPYGGWPNCYRPSNGHLELVVTSDVGPRIIRCGFPGGGQNFFQERTRRPLADVPTAHPVRLVPVD
jgi:hypothetical protein